jgi:hypothetical protein
MKWCILAVLALATIALAACKQFSFDLEAIDAEMQHKYRSIHPNCTGYMPQPPGANCTRYLWTKPITRTEWLELFPNTRFYLIGLDRIERVENNKYGYERRYLVIAQQDGRRYRLETFDELLIDNGITITDENRELAAGSLALMTLANYLEEEVVLSDWREVDVPQTRAGLCYNYAFTAWTKIQGRIIEYLFLFDQGFLREVTWYPAENNVGEYIDEPPLGVLPPWRSEETSFR